MVTASGDKTLAIWDTRNAKLIQSCRGHNGSVRAVCASRRSAGIFASGEPLQIECFANHPRFAGEKIKSQGPVQCKAP